MNAVDNARRALEMFKKHNEEQHVIQRMNAPLINKCKTWLEDVRQTETCDDALRDVITAVKKFIETGEGLAATKLLIEETMAAITKEKMEELDAYKY
jgi:hypothetical protein